MSEARDDTPGESADFLAGMAEASRARVAAARAQRPEAEMLAVALASPAPLPMHLSSRRFDLIAEVKFRSPAAGALRAGSEENVRARVAGYADSGGKPPVATGPQRRGVIRSSDLPCRSMAARYSAQSGCSPAIAR